MNGNIVDLLGRSAQQRYDEQKHYERVARVEKFIQDRGYQMECSLAGQGVIVSVIKMGAAMVDEFERLEKRLQKLEKLVGEKWVEKEGREEVATESMGLVQNVARTNPMK